MKFFFSEDLFTNPYFRCDNLWPSFPDRYGTGPAGLVWVYRAGPERLTAAEEVISAAGRVSRRYLLCFFDGGTISRIGMGG